jgi:peptide/nickel transport system substrate-binding protein
MDNKFANYTTATALLAIFAMVLGLASSCRRKAPRTPKDSLVMVLETTLRDVDPRFALSNHDMKISRLIAPGLTTSDTQDLQSIPYLAESIEEVEPLRWRVRLKPGLRFSDGTNVTAADVAYTYNSVLDPEVQSLSRKAFLERYKRVVAVNELETDFYLQKPMATFLSDLDFGIISAAADQRGGDKSFIGAGPFSLESFAQERVVLVRNENFFGKRPPLRKIVIKTVRDGTARNLMLVGGSADFSQNSVRVDLVDFIEKRDRVQVVTGKSAILSYLMMHNEDPILSDRRVREAIALAIDRPRIVDAKFGGRAVLATGLLPPFHWAYSGEVEKYNFQPERARALLDEAGYPDPDGPGGMPRLKLTYKTSASQFRLAIARVIASQLEEVGIAVEVQSFEFGTFFADVKAGNYQLASMQTSAISEPDYFYTYFHSERIPSEAQPHKHNRWRYRSDRVDELTVLGRSSMKREDRIDIYREVQQILAHDLPVIPLWHEDNIAVMNHRVQDYGVFPNARLADFARLYKK